MKLAPGTRIQGHEILQKIGQGGQGLVYRARELETGREVALKVLSTSVDREDLRRFRREGEVQSQLSHPNLVPVYRRGQEGDRLFISMELVEGPSLAQLAEGGALPDWRRAVRFAARIASALAYLHENDVLHRDVKPANILVGSDDEPRLSDFGLARRGDLTEITQVRGIMGTVKYLAPELLDGAEHGAASDVYALALTLYELVAGRSPFPADDLGEWMQQVKSIAMTPLSAYRADLPPDLGGILEKALDKDPARRPGARVLAASLEAVLEAPRIVSAPRVRTVAVVPPPPEGTITVTSGLVRRGSFAALCVLLVLGAAILVVRRPVSSPVPLASSGPSVSGVAPPTSPVAGLLPEQAALLDRFRERLRRDGETVVPLRAPRRRDAFDTVFWDALAARVPDSSVTWITRAFVALDPGGLARIAIELDGFAARPLLVELNDRALELRAKETGGLEAVVPLELVRPGLNMVRAQFATGSEGSRGTLRLRLEPTPGQDVPRLPGRRRRALSPELKAALEILFEKLHSGMLQETQALARSYLEKDPKEELAFWFVMEAQLTAARMVTDMGPHGIVGTAMPGIVGELATPEGAARQLASSTQILQRFLDAASREPRLWRLLGETLCLSGEAELGWDCLMYGALLEPEDAHSWLGFYFSYDNGPRRAELVARRVSEVKQTIDIAARLPSFPSDRFLPHFLEKAQVILAREEKAAGVGSR